MLGFSVHSIGHENLASHYLLSKAEYITSQYLKSNLQTRGRTTSFVCAPGLERDFCHVGISSLGQGLLPWMLATALKALNDFRSSETPLLCQNVKHD